MEYVHVNDPSERAFRLMERASGLRQATCPWQAYRDPYAQSVMNAAQWMTDRSGLGPRGSLPYALVRGVDVYLGALNTVTGFDTRKRIEKAERESEERERNAGFPGVPIRPRR